MIKKYFIAFTSLIFLLFAHNAFSDDSMGNIKLIINDFNTDEPIEGAEILITPCDYTGITDSNGEAIIEEVVPFRNYQIDCQADGYVDGATAFVSVEASNETVVYVPLRQKSKISGRVTMKLFLGLLQWPLGNAEVKLKKSSGQSFITIGEIQTDFWGRYLFEDLDDGSYVISAQAKQFSNETADLELEGGQEVTQNFSLSWQREESQADQPLAYANFIQSQSLLSGTDKTIKRLPDTYNTEIPVSNDPNTQAFYSEPEAVPSIIPGPSELPYLYNDHQVFSTTTGASFIEEGSTVYLRGFAVHKDITMPQDFNPGTSCFDVYGNKNGNFSASIFAYSWSLEDANGNNYTSLLKPSPASENVSFDMPEDLQTGDYLIASLIVTDDQDISSAPEEITIMVADSVDEATCSECHNDNATGYATTRHAQVEDGAGCQDCHGLGSEHPASGKMTVNYWNGVCGQCHIEFAELQKNNHSDPLPFGHYEPEGDYLTICYPCHYTPGYIGAISEEVPFHDFHYGSETLSEIPKDTPNVSCSVCHDPHSAGEQNPYGLRTGSAGTACDTCHYEKWQNAILEGFAGQLGNGYHYPGEDYTSYQGENNPHHTEDKCVFCHMDRKQVVEDANGVLMIGGHTFRMRDFGPDNIPGNSDDTLNIIVCQGCHEGLTDFDRDGFQTEVKELIATLGNLLKGNNYKFLPSNEPGNCARCHKGGTVPFLDDPDNILENAYTNYKLMVNDRSYGIHNPGYIKKLLEDSIHSIQNNYEP